MYRPCDWWTPPCHVNRHRILWIVCYWLAHLKLTGYTSPDIHHRHFEDTGTLCWTLSWTAGLSGVGGLWRHAFWSSYAVRRWYSVGPQSPGSSYCYCICSCCSRGTRSRILRCHPTAPPASNHPHIHPNQHTSWHHIWNHSCYHTNVSTKGKSDHIAMRVSLEGISVYVWVIARCLMLTLASNKTRTRLVILGNSWVRVLSIQYTMTCHVSWSELKSWW